VRAPLHSDLDLIEAHVRKRAAWILKHQQQFKQKPPPTTTEPPRCVDGAALRYLGSTYTLRVQTSKLERVQIDGDQIVVSVRDAANAEQIGARLDRWYRLQAARVFAERLQACFARVEAWGVKLPPLKIRDMKTRWGSCSSKGSVALNLRLIHQPIDLIDYVVLHELCHLKEMNHSPRFWTLMDRVLPDWRERRKRLNQGTP
jgi:predicted metal-dependent hydrolase